MTVAKMALLELAELERGLQGQGLAGGDPSRRALEWVIVRPTVLTDKPATGRIRALTDLSGFHGGRIAHADVAAFVIGQTGSDEWLRQTPLITEDTRKG